MTAQNLKIESILSGFRSQCSSLKDSKARVFNRNKDVVVSPGEANKRFASLYPNSSEKFIQIFRDHLEFLERHILFSSSPRSFKKAWELRSKYLTTQDTEHILNIGGQLIPNVKTSPLFQYNMKGLMLSPISDAFLLGVRHSEGNYHDELDDLGRFTYQPPEDLKGMLRYRFFEYLSAELKIPYIMFVSMWFSYNNNLVSGIKSYLPEETNWLYMVAPVKVISNNLLTNDSIRLPLELQTVSREEAYQIISQLKGITSSELEIDYRPTLADNIALEFSYEHIKSSPKGVAIKKWAQSSGQKCPSCYQDFSMLTLPKIHFGHILSQSWCSSFGFLQDRVHNPDNLYLSCSGCNISLNRDFPNLKLRESIAVSGTIGDWLRLYENEIRSKL